jgi:hypothetical protein
LRSEQTGFPPVGGDRQIADLFRRQFPATRHHVSENLFASFASFR